jgi:hypothetical protein
MWKGFLYSPKKGDNQVLLLDQYPGILGRQLETGSEYDSILCVVSINTGMAGDIKSCHGHRPASAWQTLISAAKTSAGGY